MKEKEKTTKKKKEEEEKKIIDEPIVFDHLFQCGILHQFLLNRWFTFHLNKF
jgi:hypothetical protein